MAIVRIVIITIVFWLVGWLLRRAMAGRPRYPQDFPGPQPSGGGSSRGNGHSPRGKKSPYEVLEIPLEATPEEVRAAYRRKVQQYHPDRVAELGPEIREVAERRMKEINAAYEELKRRNGA
ncbi:MAG: J domain-containing protein [Chloroflexi bacterium]|nr:J domain-containing protein [Chloroflexota bacterium]